MYSVSCILYLLQERFYFSYHIAGYFLDSSCITMDHWMRHWQPKERAGFSAAGFINCSQTFPFLFLKINIHITALVKATFTPFYLCCSYYFFIFCFNLLHSLNNFPINFLKFCLISHLFYILALENQTPVTNTIAIHYLHFLLALTITSLYKINVIKINIFPFFLFQNPYVFNSK